MITVVDFAGAFSLANFVFMSGGAYVAFLGIHRVYKLWGRPFVARHRSYNLVRVYLFRVSSCGTPTENPWQINGTIFWQSKVGG